MTLGALLLGFLSPLVGWAEAVPAAAAVPAAEAVPAVEIANPELFKKSLDAARQALVQYGTLDRPADLRRVADIGYRVVQAAGITQPPINFYLIDIPEPNAFALPGGQVVVTRGMLDLGLSDDELAGLLGHEIAHVTLQHGMKMERRATLLNILSQAALVGVILSASSESQQPRDPYLAYGRSEERSDLIQGTAAAGLVLSELLLRSYSREFEDQADEEGQRWIAAAGFDPSGTRGLFDLMRRRLPQDKAYGYWQTHPFFDSRVSAADARAKDLKTQPIRDSTAIRLATQKTLLDYVATIKPEMPKEVVAFRFEAGPRRPAPKDLDLPTLLKGAALAALPSGVVAEGLRAERLELARRRELERLPLARDFGRLVVLWQREIDEVRAVSPDSPYLDRLNKERAELQQTATALYPKAVETFRGGIYETAFLETFVSNYPTAEEFGEVSLALGDAYSRLGRSTAAVDSYLAAWHASGLGAAGQKARAGLRGLVSVLRDLPALQDLSDQAEDAELRLLAAARLDTTVGSFTDLASGAAFLRRFPESPLQQRVTQRLHSLADNLYGEVMLYQSVGDHAKALDRILQILDSAPGSPAAARLRERATVLDKGVAAG